MRGRVVARGFGSRHDWPSLAAMRLPWAVRVGARARACLLRYAGWVCVARSGCWRSWIAHVYIALCGGGGVYVWRVGHSHNIMMLLASCLAWETAPRERAVARACARRASRVPGSVSSESGARGMR